ncbi:MAG: class I SAM-dependent methyltransferase [Phycisphaeraceae bacterium]|nr:class I SAM-dependent methyltransferase [Phycisphaeraceae bacterium]
MSGHWDDRYEHLCASQWLYHNADYWRFLVRDVWRLDRPCRIVDFGCGYGRWGLVLLELLPQGSTYTGLDTSGPLLAKARQIYAQKPYEARFLQADVRNVPLQDDSFDLAFCHAVLMHVPEPRRAVAEMVRVTRDGGMVIACEGNRNAVTALLHIEESNELDNAPLELFQTMNRHVRERSGVDYNIGARMPILLHHAGLKDVACRVTDAVRLLLPPLDSAKDQPFFQAICNEGMGYQPSDAQEIAQWEQRLVSYGVGPAQAQKEVRRELQRDYRHKGPNYHTVWPSLHTFSYGTVVKPKSSL